MKTAETGAAIPETAFEQALLTETIRATGIFDARRPVMFPISDGEPTHVYGVTIGREWDDQGRLRCSVYVINAGPVPGAHPRDLRPKTAPIYLWVQENPHTPDGLTVYWEMPANKFSRDTQRAEAGSPPILRLPEPVHAVAV